MTDIEVKADVLLREVAARQAIVDQSLGRSIWNGFVRAMLVPVIANVLFAAPQAAQSRPYFAGKWGLVRDASAAAETAAFGESFVATQYGTSLVIDWSFMARGRGGMEQRAAHSAFIFNGTESNVEDLYSGSSHTQIADTSAWEGQKLVVITTWRGITPARVSMKRTIWLEPDGTLVVEISKPPDGGGTWSTVRSRYRRLSESGRTGAT